MLRKLLMLAALPMCSWAGTLTFTINNTGLTSLACDGKSYWVTPDESNTYTMGSTFYFQPSAVKTSDNSTYIQYAFQPNGGAGADKATLRITYTAQANCTLQANIAWTNNDGSHTLTSSSVVPWVLTVGSDTISSQTPQHVNIQAQAAYFINFTTASLAMWQDFAQPWEDLSTATWTTGSKSTNATQHLDVGVADYAGLLQTYNPSIAPSGSANYNMWLRFCAVGATAQGCAPEAGPLLQAVYPPHLQPNRGRVAIAFLSQSNNQSSLNPRGYLFVSGNNVYNPATGALGGTVVSSATTYANTVLTNATVNMTPKATAVVVWDAEGSEFLQPQSYIGHPAQLAAFAPETASFLDVMTSIWIAGGLKIGFLLRPQQTLTGSGTPSANCASNMSNSEYNAVYVNTAAFTYPSVTRLYACTATNTWTAQPATGTGYQQAPTSLTDIETGLDADIDAAIARWGLGNLWGFYIDSAVYEGGSVLSVALYQHLYSRYPTLTFQPEEAAPVLGVYATAGQFESIQNTGIIQTNATTRAYMPGAFSFIDASNQIIPGTYNAQIVSGVQAGDIYAQNSWFGTGEFTPMNALYTTAAANNSSLTMTDSSTGRLRSFGSRPMTDGVISYYQRVRFADTANNLNASTTYCDQQATTSCYSSGTLQSTAALNLSTFHFWRPEYWTFSGTCAVNCTGPGNSIP